MTLPKLEALGVHTFADLRRLPEDQLIVRFGESGEHFHRLVRGIDDREVIPDREAKSISHEVTFSTDIEDPEYLRDVLLDQTEHVTRRLRRHERLCRTVTLKVRTDDFKTVTRSTTLGESTDHTETIWEAAGKLFETWQRRHTRPVRLIGMGVSHLSSRQCEQLNLFSRDEDSPTDNLDRTVDRIKDRFGDDAISRGRPVKPRKPHEAG